MGFAIDIGAGNNNPVPPLQPAAGVSASSTVVGQRSSEQASADMVGAIVAGGVQDGLTATYNAPDQSIDFTNTDKGSVAVAAHEAALDPHPQYVADGDTLAVGLTMPLVNLIPGTAPVTPVDGDMWTTIDGLFVQVNGATVGPLSMGSDANRLISGGGVAFVGGFDLIVSAATYSIGGVVYSSPETPITVSTADAVFGRIDVVALDDTGTAFVIPGTPAPTPAKPDVDLETQLELTFFFVAAGSTTLPIGNEDVYKENTEWTSSTGGTINAASTADPHTGTVSVEYTASGTNQIAAFSRGSTVPVDAFGGLVFYIKSKATWPLTRSLVVTLRYGSTLIGEPVTLLPSGTFGFNSSNTASYKVVVLPIANFAATGQVFDRVWFTVKGSGAGIGLFLDDISFQAGLSLPLASEYVRWRGNYNSLVMYQVNDMVLHSDGIQYVCIVEGAGNDPDVSPLFWQPSTTAGGGAGLVDADYGDVIVSGSGTVMSLDVTGVAAATYTRPTIDVDAKGRITAAADGPLIDLATDVTGVLPVANFATGSPSGSKFVRDDGVLAVPSIATSPYVKGAAWSGAPVASLGADVVYGVAQADGFITACVCMGAPGGSATFEVWKTTYAGGLPTAANKISGGTAASISSGTKSRDTALTGWTTAVTRGDVFAFKLLTSSTFTWVSIQLEIEP